MITLDCLGNHNLITKTVNASQQMGVTEKVEEKGNTRICLIRDRCLKEFKDSFKWFSEERSPFLNGATKVENYKRTRNAKSLGVGAVLVAASPILEPARLVYGAARFLLFGLGTITTGGLQYIKANWEN